jgi:steroid 5-alpha reductase family enzyme
MIHLALIGLLVMVVLMALLWGVHLVIRNAAVVDVGWAAGLALLGTLYSVLGTGYAPRRWLIAIMVVLWGLRLTSHLLRDRIIGKPEEGRYQALREEWKTHLPLRFFVFFQFQAFLDVLLSLPFLLMAVNPHPELSLLEWAGFVLWIFAILGESIADHQLKIFKADPVNRGKVCQSGLWAYSRHPNYFFEWLIWVAFFIAALASPWGWTAVICPGLILYFLLQVTGIPATEAQALRSRGDAYREYQRTTSMFVPWGKKS